MGVIIALGAEKVSVAVGSLGGRPTLRRLIEAPVREAGIAGWEAAIAGLWETNKLPRSGVTVVLPGNVTASKLMNAPDMPEKRLRELVQHEMQSREEKPTVTDYMVLGKDAEGHLNLFCVSCTRELFEQFLDMFGRLKLKLERITAPLVGHIRLLAAMPEMREKTCIWLNFEGSAMLSMLIENGTYRYAGRNRIFSEPGTIDFGTEVSRIVSGTLQFQSASHSTNVVTDVYYGGCPDDIFEACLPGIRSLGLAVDRLPEPACFKMRVEGQKVSDWLDCADAMLR